MSTVNKQSLREEFDALKAEFEHLTVNGKVAAESRALFQAMLMLFEVPRVRASHRTTPCPATRAPLRPSKSLLSTSAGFVVKTSVIHPARDMRDAPESTSSSKRW